MPEFTAIPDISALYAGLFGITGIVLSFFAGKLRGKTGISIGDGGNTELLLAMRRHANFVEYVPLALIIIALMEMNGAHDYAIHGLCVALLIARISHAVGLKADTVAGMGRLVGAAGTVPRWSRSSRRSGVFICLSSRGWS